MESGNRWNRQRDSNHVSNANQRGGKKGSYSHIDVCLFFLKMFMQFNIYFKKLNKHILISWVLVRQRITYGCPCRRVIVLHGIGNGTKRCFLSLKLNLSLKRENKTQVTMVRVSRSLVNQKIILYLSKTFSY